MTATLLHLRRAAARAVAASTSAAARRAAATTSSATLRTGATSCASLRSFQTTASLLKQHTTDVTKDAKRSVAAALANKRNDDEEVEEEEEGSEDSDSDDDDDAESDDEEEEDDEDEEDDAAAEIDPENPAAAYIGVTYYPSKVKKYSAELHIDGHVISGGDYWTALDAAKGYDELVDLYCDLDTPRNFPAGAADAEDAAAGLGDAATGAVSEWEVPEVGKRHADIIPPIPQYVRVSTARGRFGAH